MTPAELITWRKRLGLTAKAAAEALGLSINGYAAYERGYMKVVSIPLKAPYFGHGMRLLRKELVAALPIIELACCELERRWSIRQSADAY